MTIESMVYLLQQGGAVLLAIILIYQLHQWIRESCIRDDGLKITLQEAKVVREEAWDRSLEILSSYGERYDLLRKPTSIQTGCRGNKSPFMYVKYTAKKSNPFKESEVIPVLSNLNCDEKRLSSSALLLNIER